MMNDEQMIAIQNAADEFGVNMDELVKATARAAETLGGVFMALLQPIYTISKDIFSDRRLNMIVKKSLRRERFLRRYKRRGERMKKK